MKKIKILYLVSTLKKCGPINILYGILKSLDKKTFDIYIICLSRERKNSMIGHFRAIDIPIINLNNARVAGVFRNTKAVQSFVDSKQIDMSHSHGLRADSINSRLKNVITFNTIHNFPGEDYIFQFGAIMGSLMEMKHKKAIRNIDIPISCSKSIAEKFKLKYKINSSWIQNGIEINDFDITTGKKHELRKKLALPTDKIIFIVSGSLIPRKNPELIIKGFHQFDEKKSVLIFIGGGKLYKSLREQYAKNSIIFLNNVLNVSEYLSSSDYYISASSSEGLPNSVLEALSSGLPTVLSDIPAHREIVGKGYTYLFKKGSVDDLCGKMKLIIQDDYQSLSVGGINIVKSKFNSVLMSDSYQSKYLETCQNLER